MQSKLVIVLLRPTHNALEKLMRLRITYTLSRLHHYLAVEPSVDCGVHEAKACDKSLASRTLMWGDASFQ